MIQPALFQEGELAPAPEPLCVAALAIWNEICGPAGWPAARFLTHSRRVALRRAIPDYGGLAAFRIHLAAASQNDFLTGKTERTSHKNWRPDLDWFLKPANVLKVLEGKWPANTGAAAPQPKPVDPLEGQRRMLRLYRPRGFWPNGGVPRPEEPGAERHFDAELLDEWRKRHGVKVEPRKVETLEERIAGTIASYRKVGNHARADALEVQLAELRGEKLVTLPPRPEPVEKVPNDPKRYQSAPVDVEPIYDDAIPEGEDWGDE